MTLANRRSPCEAVTLSDLALPEEVGQIVLVTTGTWKHTTGTLRTFSKSQDKWIAEGKKTPVTVGRGGLGWGEAFMWRTTESHRR